MATRETVVAVYDNYETANRALQLLLDEGFSRDNIGLAVNNGRREGEYSNLEANVEQYEDVTGPEGSTFGAAMGGIAGAAVALSAIVIPGIGPIIAAGPLVALLGGATGALIGGAAGAVAGGITASLIHLGIPDDEADYYAESLRRGNALVTVTVNNDNELTMATQLLRRFSPIDVQSRANNWREKEGWTGYEETALPYRKNEDLPNEEMVHPGVDEPYYGTDEAVRHFPYNPPVIPKN